MPITTRTVAKGIPPRVHEPKGKAKQPTKPKLTTKSKRRHKQVSEEELESEEGSSSPDNLEPRVKSKRKIKKRRIEDSEAEAELIEDNVDPPNKEVESIEGDNELPEVSTDHPLRDTILTKIQEDDLNDHQRGADLQEKPVKKDSTLDLLMIMSDKITVKFKVRDGDYETEIGRWCNTCK